MYRSLREPNVQWSKPSLKVVADTFVQINTTWVYRWISQSTCLRDGVSCITIMLSWCMWVEYCPRKWWHNYSICVLERETESCVSVYAKMPGVNTTHLQYIRSRHNLESRFVFFLFLVERRTLSFSPSICLFVSPHTSHSLPPSLALSLSAPRPVYIHEALSLYRRSSFLLDVVSTVNCAVDVSLFHGNVAPINSKTHNRET